jgi:hypothetical protein
MKTTNMTLALVLALAQAGPALAQTQEDDHATTSSGHDPEAEARGAMRIREAEPQATVDSTQRTFGVGYGATPGGVAGAQVEYYLANLMLNFHAGYSTFSPDEGESQSLFMLAGGAFWRFRSYDPVALLLGGRLSFAHAPGASYMIPEAKPQVVESESSTQVNVELVAAVQVFFGGIIGVKAEVGPVISFIDGLGLVGDGLRGEYPGLYLRVPNANLLATFSALIYID